MLWKVIVFLVVLVLALLFIGFNLGNRADVSVGFHVWQNVPVFLSMFFSFAFGVLCMVPFLVRIRLTRGGRGAPPKEKGGSEPAQQDQATGSTPPARS